MTYLAVSLYAKDLDCFTAQFEQARAQGAEAIEVRADALLQPSIETVVKMIQMIRKADLPVIVTCRDKEEGGFKEVVFSLRLSILDQRDNLILYSSL